MFEDGELMKRYFQCKLEFPTELTKEEIFLKSKYEMLRKAKEELSQLKGTTNYRKNDNFKCVRKNRAIAKTVNLMKENINSKKTVDFKNWSKQAQQTAVKRQYPIHSFEEDSKPRSIKVCGEHLTEEFLRKHFNKFGDIFKIRTNEDKTSSVLTFKGPTNAVNLAEVLNGTVIDGVKLEVSVLRKNSSWSNTDNNSDTKLQEMKSRGKSVHLSYKGYLTHRDFEEFFQMVGRITRIYLNETKHFGFAMFENEEQARRAISEMNGQICKGITVYVSPQKFSKNDSPKTIPQPTAHSEEREMISYEDLDV